MTSRTHDNFRHNFWTWVDPPPFWTMFKKTSLFLHVGFPKSHVLPEEAFVLPDAILNLVKMTSVFVKWSSWWLKSRQNVHLFRVRADSSRGPLSAINYRLDFPPHRITHEDRLSIQGKAEHWKKNIQRMLTWTSHAFTYMCVCRAHHLDSVYFRKLLCYQVLHKTYAKPKIYEGQMWGRSNHYILLSYVS